MRCPKCNSAIPIGGNNCRTCGYDLIGKQSSVPQKQKSSQKTVEPPKKVLPFNPPKPPIPPEPPKPIKKNTKHKEIITTVLIVLLAIIAGRFWGTWIENVTQQNRLSDAEDFTFSNGSVDYEFDTFLAQFGLSYFPQIDRSFSECFVFPYVSTYTLPEDLGLNSDAQVKIIQIWEYGYIEDSVTESIDTQYFDLSDFSQSDKEQIIWIIQDEFDHYFEQVMDYYTCEVHYDYEGDYFVVTFSMSYYNCEDDEINSMSQTISDLISLGYIQR